ncbi:MAG: IclR family transcriptional regulator [Armatimonadetes bacterium]|nr:IclR family transcriptional regulator [Armatimonadota bacterium]
MGEAAKEPAPAGAKSPQLVQSLSRGLGILSHFTAESRRLSLTDLSRRTGLHRATVYRFVRTLEAEGFLTYDPDSGFYGLGPAWAAALYSLGNESVLAEILNDDMQALSEKIGETVTLAVRRGDHVQIIAITHSSRLFTPRLPSSSLVALNEFWNVHAKIHLAYASEDTQRRMLAVPATRYTDKTITDPKVMAALLAKVVEEGVAYDREEQQQGVCAIAVPVFEKRNVILALGVVTPVERCSKDDVRRLRENLMSAAKIMEVRLEKAAHSWIQTAVT